MYYVCMYDIHIVTHTHTHAYTYMQSRLIHVSVAVSPSTRCAPFCVCVCAPGRPTPLSAPPGTLGVQVALHNGEESATAAVTNDRLVLSPARQ